MVFYPHGVGRHSQRMSLTPYGARSWSAVPPALTGIRYRAVPHSLYPTLYPTPPRWQPYQRGWEALFVDALLVLGLHHSHPELAGWRQAAAMWKVGAGHACGIGEG